MSTPAWQRWLPWGRSTWSQGNITQTNDPAATAGGPERRIYLNTELPAGQLDPHGHPIRTYPPNRINTSKYSLITFVPKNLFEQFRRVANQYFLFLIILQLIPAVSEGSAALSALALGFILFVTALKDGYEDFKRHQSDDELNHERTYVLKDWTNPNASVRAATSSLPVWLQRLVSFWQPSTLGARGSRRHQISLDHHAEKPFTQSAHGLDDPAQWSKTYWQQVQVGDVVRLRDDDPVPADLLILATSDPDGLCYVETKNLDGETNLKLRKALPATYAWASLEELRTSPLYVDCEAPNTNLYSFKGTVTHTRAGTARTAAEVEQIGQTEPVSIDNVLLRGCVLRNTQYIVGLVLYTGAESKIILNSGETPSKRSNIERLMNTQVSLNFIMLFILCLLSAICGAFIYNQSDTSQAVFATVFDPDPDSAPFLGFLTFWMGLILFQNIVPISLYISIELVKTIQAYFIYSDLDMYFAPLDRPCMPKTWNISDDLGQVQYIFSDKTGTLTQNVMEFRQCTIHGTIYGELFDPDEDLPADAASTAVEKPQLPTQASHEVLQFPRRSLQPVAEDTDSAVNEARPSPNAHNHSTEFPSVDYASPGDSGHGLHPLPHPPVKRSFADAKQQMMADMSAMFHNQYFDEDDVTFVDVNLFRHLSADDAQARAIVEFFTILSVCHSVLAERPDPANPNKIVYKAQSPDEAALVSAARNSGFTFLRREQDIIHCDFLGRPQQFKLLNVLEFNSTRKRMSVIIERADGRVVLLCKGADSIVFERLRRGQTKVKEDTLNHLKYFATSGLRTLCLGYCILPADEYAAWAQEYDAASNLLDGRDEALDAAAERIERNLTLVGGTAIEDRLQDGVPETIAQLASGGVKIWVLTGDKTETAINIGFSCNLLNDDMQLIVITGTDADSTAGQLQDAFDLFGVAQGRMAGSTQLPGAVPDASPKSDTPGLDELGNPKPLALVIDGESLKYALEPALDELFLKVAHLCDAVICCRVSPLQKALVVRCVKEKLKVLCLAIGDGANDVSMIQEAHIGVGIAGEEGLQAVLASDYSIAQFRFLQKLMLVHGRWSYIRIANMILIFFYKNIVFTFALFWFQIYCSFTLTFLFDYALMMFYNLAFTSIPILILGVLDQDVEADVSMVVPQLYRSGIQGKEYNMSRFWLHTLDAIYQSLVCVLLPFYTYGPGTTARFSGLDDSEMNELGTVSAICIVCVVNLYVALNMRNWTWLVPVVVTLSTLSLTLFLGIYCQMNVSALYHMDVQIYTQGSFYFSVALVLVVCMFPRFFFKFLHQTFFPTDADIIREAVYVFKRRFQSRHYAAADTPGHIQAALAKKNGTHNLSPQCIPLTAPHAQSPNVSESISLHRGDSPPPTLLPTAYELNSTAQRADSGSMAAHPSSLVDGRGAETLQHHLQRMSSLTSAAGSMRRQHSTRRRPFTTVMHRLRQKTLFFMRTKRSEPNTGFSYSQHHQSSLSLQYSRPPSMRSVEPGTSGLAHRSHSRL